MDEEEIAELYLAWKLEVLKELRQYLVKNLEPDKLYTFLRSCDALDEGDEEEIRSQVRRTRRNEMLIDLITNRGSEGFDNFCEAIRQNTTQLFVLRKILHCFHKKKDGHNLLAEQSLPGNGANPDLLLPIPGHPGGPPVPDFGRTNDAITAMNEVSLEGRSRSPPPPYSEQVSN